MDVKEQYRKLSDRWIATRGEEREAADRDLDAFFESLTEEDKPLLHEAIDEHLARMRNLSKEMLAISEHIKVRRQLEAVLPFISVAEFARTYFGRTSSWMHQRINQYLVHGKPVNFTPDELKTLSAALKDVGMKLLEASAKVAS